MTNMKSGTWVRYDGKDGETFTNDLGGYIWVQFDGYQDLVPITALEVSESLSQQKITVHTSNKNQTTEDQEDDVND